MEIKREENQEAVKNLMNKIKKLKGWEEWSKNILRVAKTICGTSRGV